MSAVGVEDPAQQRSVGDKCHHLKTGGLAPQNIEKMKLNSS